MKLRLGGGGIDVWVFSGITNDDASLPGSRSPWQRGVREREEEIRQGGGGGKQKEHLYGNNTHTHNLPALFPLMETPLLCVAHAIYSGSAVLDETG